MKYMIGMNNGQNVVMNATQSIDTIKMRSVISHASIFIMGKLMEIIEGDVHMKERQELSK